MPRRADGIERRAADKRWVILRPHVANPGQPARLRRECVTRTDYVRVRRVAPPSPDRV